MMLEELVRGALAQRPATVGELCAALAAAGLVGDRRLPPVAGLPWPDVTIDVAPNGQQVLVCGPAGTIVAIWDEYPQVRYARAVAAREYRWP